MTEKAALLFLLLLSMCSITYWLLLSESVTLIKKNTMIPLASCPITAPHLLGPLHIQIDRNMTLETVRNELNSVVQVGGRYKPPDCKSLHKVAIIIPFRKRHSQLIHWLRYLHPILQRQQLDYGVYVINQDGEGTFNRAKLLNVGVVEALKEYDYSCFVFSDVDLILLDDRNSYGCFSEPRHLAVAMDKLHFQMPYRTFFGGVASLSIKQYMKINGFPNNYWGWGGEDDDMHQRVILRNMTVSRPSLLIGKYKMFKHDRDVHNEPGPQNAGMLSRTKWTMETDGINSLAYNVTNVEKDKLYTFITVDVGHPK